MNNAVRKFGFVLQAGMMILGLSGCGGKQALPQKDLVNAAFDDLRAVVVQTIDDTERQSSTIGLVTRLERDYEKLHDSVLTRRQRIRALNADYDATREAFVLLIEQLDADVREAVKSVGVTHRELVASTTSDEWASITKASMKATKAAISALQPT